MIHANDGFGLPMCGASCEADTVTYVRIEDNPHSTCADCLLVLRLATEGNALQLVEQGLPDVTVQGLRTARLG